jgi:RHS repeat-associated protein
MKKHNILSFLFFILSIFAVKSQSVNLDLYTDATFSRTLNTSTPVGYTAGSLDVGLTGSASYTIPITLPPGTKGVTPSVTIAYSSQGGNGIMGMGWNIGATSSISRIGRNQLYDSEITPVKLNTEDFYALDGNRLEVTTGNYGVDASIYATRMETFSQITSYGNISGCPQWFKVEAKNGMIYEYGNTPDSRYMDEASAKVISWQLNKMYDQYGNYTEYTYEMNGRELRIKEINYTGNTAAGLTPYNKVKFNYLDRTDKKTLYVAGVSMAINSLLTEIIITTENGGLQVKKFAFNYGKDDISQSFLKEVIEFGANSTSQLNSTIFKYGNKTSENTQETVNGQPSPGDVFSGDFSGDGVTDYLYAIKSGTQPGGPGSAYFIYYTQLKTFIKDNLNGGFYGGLQDITLPINSVKINKDLSANVNSSFLVEDYNGDGKSDIMVLSVPPSTGQPVVSGATIYMSKADEYAGSFLPPTSFDPTWNITYPQTCGYYDEFGYYQEYDCSYTIYYNVVPANGRFIYSADFNGDGLTDVISIFKQYYSDSKYIFSTPATGYKIVIGGTNSFPFDWSQADNINVLDQNGDGKPDLMVTKDGRSITYTFNNSGSASVIYDSGFPTKWHDKILPGDFNGDGKTDLLTRSSNGIWYLSYSKGDFFTDIVFPFTSTPDVSGSNFRNIQVGDHDGNGLSDVMYIKTNFSGSVGVSRTVDTYFSNGNSFTKKSFTTTDLTGRPEIAGDFNGDGKTDILFRGAYNSPYKIYYFTPDSKNLLLEKATNGFNVTTSVAYQKMTDQSSNAVYNSTSNISTYPINNIRLPMWLASSLTVPDGIGSNTITTYKYKDAKIHRRGAGFLGFTYFQTDNATQNAQSITEFEVLTPQFLTAIKKQTVKQLLPYQTISELTNTNSVTVNGVRFWQKQDGYVQNNQLTGATKSIWRSFDNFGNINTESYNINNIEEGTTQWYYYNPHGSPIPAQPDYVSTYNRRGLSSNFDYTWTSNTYNAKGDLTNTEFMQYDYNTGWNISNTTSYGFHPTFGVLTSTTLSSPGLPSKTTTINSYDAKWRFPTNSTNPLGQSSSKVYDPRWGTVLNETGIEGLTTYYTYDAFGRVIGIMTPQYTNITKQYAWSYNGQYLPKKCYDIITSIPGRPSTWDIYDVFGRKTVATTENYGDPNARWVYTYQTTDYDTRGNVYQQSNPVNGTEWNTDLELTTFQYDGLNRVLSSTLPTIGTTAYTYTDNTGVAGESKVTVTSPSGQVSSKTTDATGKVVSTTDYGGTLTFTYNNKGKQTEVKLNGTSISTMTYDYRGNQKTLTDKNAGTTEYRYNAYGQLEWQKDANATEYNMTYDMAGRLVTRTGPEGTTTNQYVPSSYGINQIKKIIGFNGITQEYVYDQWHRVSQAIETIDGTPYTKTLTYNAYNNVETTTYPDGLVIKNSYSPDGYLFKVEQNGGQILFDGTNGVMNGYGKWRSYTLGNGITSNITYNKLSVPTNYSAGSVQNLTLNWNITNGNLNSRYDARKGRTESFTYDNLDRLTGAQVSGLGLMSFNYASNGNINTKSDAGSYTYDVNKINAVTSISNTPNPSVIPSFQQDITYTKFLRPEKILEGVSGGTYGSGNYELSYTYASDYERRKGVLKVNGSIVNTRLYMGDYEIDTKNGVTRHIHYIGGGDGLCAIVVKENGAFNFYFPYTDHLGSILTVTNTSGTVVGEQNFDAWGRKRNVNTWDYAGIVSVPDWLYRGYTGHEHLTDFGLVNMNARLYDPVLGMMLNSDNFVGINGSQGFNRYSYGNNNPLKFVDPDGNNPLIIAAIFFAWSIAVDYTVNPNNSWEKRFQSAGINALASLVTAGVSGGVQGVLAGQNFFGAALNGITGQAIASSANSTFWTAFAPGALGSIAGSAFSSFLQGDNFGKFILKAAPGIAYAGWEGHLAGKAAQAAGYDYFTGEKIEVDNSLNLNGFTQMPKEAYCNMYTAKNLQPLVGSPYNLDLAVANTPMTQVNLNGTVIDAGTKIDEALSNGGYSLLGAAKFNYSVAAAATAQKIPVGITYSYDINGQTLGHTVALQRTQTIINQAGKTTYRVWVMDPNRGIVRFYPNKVTQPIMFGVGKNPAYNFKMWLKI